LIIYLQLVDLLHCRLHLTRLSHST